MGLMAPAPKVASDVVLRNIVSSMGGLSSKQALRRVRGVGDLAMNLLDEYSSSSPPTQSFTKLLSHTPRNFLSRGIKAWKKVVLLSRKLKNFTSDDMAHVWNICAEEPSKRPRAGLRDNDHDDVCDGSHVGIRDVCTDDTLRAPR